jgi:hypothetical protein
MPPTTPRHPQSFEVPRGDDVLWLGTDSELINDVEGGGIDYIDLVIADIGHIDPLQSAANDRTWMPRSSLTIQIARIKDRRHTLHGRKTAGGFFFR